MHLVKTFAKEQIERGWWVKILTTKPCCTYYFGPFESTQEAVFAHHGYIEDLVGEGARGITVRVKWCQPKELTIFPDDESEKSFQTWVS